MNKIEELLKEHEIDATKLSRLFSNTLHLNHKLIKKIERLPVKNLKKVHKDSKTAKELIMLFLTTFNNTYLIALKSLENSTKKEGFKQLYSEYLRKNIGSNYKAIIKLLINEGIIVKGRNYFVNKRCTEYRLSKFYFNLKFSEYQIESDLVIKKLEKKNLNLLIQAICNPIARNNLDNLSNLELPSRSKIEKRLLEVAKSGYTNKKGKTLKKLGKKKRVDHFVYVEDYLDIFDYLTIDYLIPIISQNAGGRVYTSLNLLPSLIKEEFGLIEVDYSCLHPNLANKIYEGSRKSITHDIVAQYLGIGRKEAKIEHLSFFNKDFLGMSRSPLLKYYMDKEPKMMHNLIIEKKEKGYRDTSLKLFTLETKIMTEVLIQLKENGIYAVYNFDAFLVDLKDVERTKSIMNDVLKKYGVNTVAK